MATRTNKVEVEITAIDEASPKIDKLTQKIDGLEADEARIRVSADITKLDAQLTDALAKMHNLEGDELTVQMRAVGTLEDDLIAARQLLEQLDGKTGTVKLSADTSDLDEGLRNASDGTDRLSRSASGANNALANMVGNSAQDLGELGGVVGSLGVGIGQMAEYASDAALDGERLGSALGSMAKVAGPIALLTVAVLGTKSAVEGLSEANELGATMQERWNTALEDGGDAASKWVEQMRETRELVVDMTDLDGALRDVFRDVEGFSWGRFFNPLAGGRKQVEDITELFERAGITIDQLSQAITGGADVQARFRDAVAQSSLSADDQLLVLSLLTQETERYTAAKENAAKFSNVFDPQPVQQSKDAMTGLADEQERYLAGLEDRADEADQERRVSDEVERHYSELARVNTEAERVDRARIAERERDAVSRVRDEYRALRDDLADRKSLLQLEERFARLQDSATQAWDAAKTGAEDAEAKQRDYQIAQIDTTDAVLDYIDQLGNVPDQVTTAILTLLDQGRYADVQTALDNLSADRSVTFRAHLDELALQRELARFYASIGQGGSSAGGGGGPRAAAVASVSSVAPITINMPVGSRGVDVLRQVSGQARRSGRRYGVPVVHYARRAR